MFDFTPIRKARPVKHRTFDCKILRDFVCVYCDITTTLWSVWMSTGDSIDNLTTEKVIDTINHILYKKNQRTTKAKVLIFINDIQKLQIFGKIDIYEKDESKKVEVELDHCVFRDAERLSKDGIKSLEHMIDIITSYDVEPCKMRLTYASQAKKEFFKPIEKDCWNDIKKHGRFTNDLDTYYGEIAGTTAGFLRLNEYTCGKIIYSVTSFDKSSAYPSKYVQISDFPIGKVYEAKTRKLEKLSDLIKSGQWFQIVFENVELPSNMTYFKSKYYASYGINQYDYALCYKVPSLYDTLINCLNMFDFKLFFSDESGYLIKPFRDRIVEHYELKESAKTKEEKSKYKVGIDLLYGKSIQKQFFETDGDVFRYYSHRGENYLLPHWARIVVSSTKLEVFNAWLSDPMAVAADTDSVKSLENVKKLEHMFSVRNAEIMKLNENSGYSGCKIGTWKKEYTASRFLQLTHKQYLYETDDGITYKIAGFPKDDIDSELIKRNISDPFNFFVTKPELLVTYKSMIKYDAENDRFERVKRLVKVGDFCE